MEIVAQLELLLQLSALPVSLKIRLKDLGSRESPSHHLSGPGAIKAFTEDEEDGGLIPTLTRVCWSADLSLSGQLLNGTLFSAGEEIAPHYME